MYKNTNRDRVIEYFRSGSKGSDLKPFLGVEIEHFIVTEDGCRPVPYQPIDGALGVQNVLEYLSEFYPEETRTDAGELLGLASEDGSITIEPSAQLEISIAPFTEVADVQAAYERFRSRLDPFLHEHGAQVKSVGYHPTAKAQNLLLIPKKRYDFMNDYFHTIGTHGERMMRASASTQVSVDYSNETDAVRKMRVAGALTPVLSAITDNVQVFEAEQVGYSLARLGLWRDVDNARCGVIPGLFDEGFGFGSYADWILSTPPIFVTRPTADDPDGPALRAAYNAPAADVYADAEMTTADIEHLLSMFWPDVRLKKFVEIRPADCLPAAQAYGYAALVKGLFYSEDSLAAIERALGVHDGIWPIDESSVFEAIESIRREGYDANVYGMPLRRWIDLLFDSAKAALPENEQHYLQPLRDFAFGKQWNDPQAIAPAQTDDALSEEG